MNTQGISPRSDSLGAFPILLKDLTQRRLHAKAKVRETTGEQRAYWDALQESFKILINSFYGYLGFGAGHFNDFDAAERVTLEGQRIIRHVVDVLEQQAALPIEVDTDGVYFQPPPDLSAEDEEAFIEDVGSELGAGIRLAHDGSYAHMLSLKMKTYALLDEHGHLTLKGSALRSRRMEGYLQQFIREAARAFMSGNDSAARESYFEVAERLQSRQIDPAEIGQWAMLRRATAEKNARLSKLLRATQGEWQFGERVILYERENGELGLIQHYNRDENTGVLLRKLRDTATRFESLFPSRAEFDAFFPEVHPTTDLALARERKAVHQLSLFGD